ncbi:hypothetical protein [Nonomuraea zeae]|uniref:Secreted protein n=1 Tax=Nonomuraea zeae TaxID=1642303 RepID=A0A5S4FYN2_9ACTN|nr:hypothetical protein [Nonomuraea zeae]TMR25915.1 hypothetical protein ETD85_44260 [Nonomuraea zeae]
MSRPLTRRHAAAALTALLSIPLTVIVSTSPAQAATTCARAQHGANTISSYPWDVPATTVASAKYNGRQVSVQHGWAYVAGGGGSKVEVAFGQLVPAGSSLGANDGISFQVTTNGGSDYVACGGVHVHGAEKFTSRFYAPHPNDSNYLFRACYSNIRTGVYYKCTGWW